jgi:integrase
LVKVPGLETNYASDLDVVSIPRPPTRHHPFLCMDELPGLLRAIEEYKGAYQTRLGLRLLLLTGVRTCKLRLATPDQFDLERGLWIIPPYIVPLSTQAMEVVRNLLRVLMPSQRYMLRNRKTRKRGIETHGLSGAVVGTWPSRHFFDGVQ